VAAARTTTFIESPPFLRHLFSDTRFAWIWLILRLYVGYQWIVAGYEKLENPAWISTGTALQGFWAKAVVVTDGKGPITYGWFRDFLNGLLASHSWTWFGPLIAVGEVLIGIGLIVGGLTAIAAFFGAFMNLNFMLAGSASTNPVLFLLAILIVVAWKTAGYWGVDRFINTYVGTPWHKGQLFGGEGLYGNRQST
jgi:thiosulfate dehydrogenase (quinone) large subunit